MLGDYLWTMILLGSVGGIAGGGVGAAGWWVYRRPLSPEIALLPGTPRRGRNRSRRSAAASW